MAEPVAGRLFEAGSSRNAAARLSRSGARLRLDTDGGEEALPEDAVRSVSPVLGRTPRRISFADGRLFETSDSAGVDALFPSARGRFASVAGWRLGALAAATVAAVAALVVFGVPVAAGIAASLTPQSVRGFIDDGALASIDAIGLAETDDARDLPDAFAAMMRAAGEDPARYRVLVLDAPRIGPNAFALPGGTIAVTTDLLSLLDRDEVLAVLAHEVGHVNGDHGLQLLYRALGLRAVVDGLTGGAGAAVDVMAENAAAVLSLQNTRDFERDADAAAVGILLAAGRDPTALADALEALAADCPACGESSFLSTHPGIAERAETIRGLANEAAPRRD